MMVGNGLPTTQPDGCAFFPPCHQVDSALEAAIMHRTFYLEMDILLPMQRGTISAYFSRSGKLREIAREVTVTREFQSLHLLPSSHDSHDLIPFYLLQR